jgi:hypothetical protein
VTPALAEMESVWTTMRKVTEISPAINVGLGLPDSSPLNPHRRVPERQSAVSNPASTFQPQAETLLAPMLGPRGGGSTILQDGEFTSKPVGAQKKSSLVVYDRRHEHASDAMRLLDRLREAAKRCECPSTRDLQQEGRYGLRPVNRIGDLRRLGHDVERIRCGRSVFCWKLHEPPRPSTIGSLREPRS